MRTRELSTSRFRRPSSRRGPRVGRPASKLLALAIFGNTPSRWGRRVKAPLRIRAVLLRRRVMRTYDTLLSCGLIALALGFAPEASFDGRPSDAAPGTSTAVPAAPATAARPSIAAPRAATPNEALRSGMQAVRSGKPDQAVTSLEYAAEQGVPGAMWKLGRMYADGDGVDQNKLRAFEYFKNLTKAHAYDPPGTPQARFVASAFVALASFYIEGIPDTSVKADPA